MKKIMPSRFFRRFFPPFFSNFWTALAALMLFCAWTLVRAQNLPPPPAPGGSAAPGTVSGQPLPAEALDNLVAPIALYPDPLVGEIMAASTYPVEIAEAEQWVMDHPHWRPTKLMDEAKKQHWDPSVQGLVAFPQVLARLGEDIGWTTQLGNAFLGQQAEVMQAVQRMRARAQSEGRLQSSPQETVTTQNRDGQSVIDIEPADQDMWYVPDYNPAYIWGPPTWGYYPPLVYPPIDAGFIWGPGIDLGLYFGGWGGWGWTPNWYGGGIYLNGSFFHRYGFHGFHGDRLGREVWAHNPEHRLGVPYANRQVAGRFAARPGPAYGGFERGFGGRPEFGSFGAPGRFGSPGFEQRGWTNSHSVFGGYHNGGFTRMQSDHGFSSMGAGRTFGGGFQGGFRGGAPAGGFHGGGFHGGGGRR